MLPIHWLSRRSHNYVVETFEVDVFAKSNTKPFFNMMDVNVHERNSLMATLTLKSKAGAYQTRLFATFTESDKSYLTYPYPTFGVDKNRITSLVINTLVV